MKTIAPSILIILSLVCVARPLTAQAVSPPPDGGYPGGNTAEGSSALLSCTTGIYNSAIGIYSLLSVTTGSFNTGIGAGTLLANTADENTATGAGALLSNTTGVENFLATQKAALIRPLAKAHSLVTPPAHKIR